MMEKRLVLNFNGKDSIKVCLDHSRDAEIILSIDGVKSGIRICRELFERDPEDNILLPIINDITLKSTVGFEGYNEGYSEKIIPFVPGLESDYKLSPENIVDLSKWSPAHIIVDMENKEITIYILTVNKTTLEESEEEYFIEKFKIYGLKSDNWEDLDINGASMTVGNHIKINPSGLVEILVHNKQNVDLGLV